MIKRDRERRRQVVWEMKRVGGLEERQRHIHTELDKERQRKIYGRKREQGREKEREREKDKVDCLSTFP